MIRPTEKDLYTMRASLDKLIGVHAATPDAVRDEIRRRRADDPIGAADLDALIATLSAA